MLVVHFSVFNKLHVNYFYLISDILLQEVKLINQCDNCDEVLCDCVSEFRSVKDKTPLHTIKVEMDGYLFSLFYYVLQTSVPYRTCFINYICKKCMKVKERIVDDCLINISINLVPVKQEMLDYKGNEMFEVSCLERRELDNAMAWLSTLGGAFSALGDSIERCATIAGKISLRQLEISLRLGDPFLIARCKLYMALSLIQRHKFTEAKEIILAQYAIATQGKIKDNKLKSMCLGIWAKLKYDRSVLKEALKSKKLKSAN